MESHKVARIRGKINTSNVFLGLWAWFFHFISCPLKLNLVATKHELFFKKHQAHEHSEDSQWNFQSFTLKNRNFLKMYFWEILPKEIHIILSTTESCSKFINLNNLVQCSLSKVQCFPYLIQSTMFSLFPPCPMFTFIVQPSFSLFKVYFHYSSLSLCTYLLHALWFSLILLNEILQNGVSLNNLIPL